MSQREEHMKAIRNGFSESDSFKHFFFGFMKKNLDEFPDDTIKLLADNALIYNGEKNDTTDIS